MFEDKIVYVSGPMTGVEDFNYPLFNKVTRKLKNRGAIVLNPARHPIGLQYDQYMHYASLDVNHCNIICLLPGYKESKGAMKEAIWAFGLGKMFVRYHAAIIKNPFERINPINAKYEIIGKLS